MAIRNCISLVKGVSGGARNNPVNKPGGSHGKKRPSGGVVTQKSTKNWVRFRVPVIFRAVLVFYLTHPHGIFTHPHSSLKHILQDIYVIVFRFMSCLATSMPCCDEVCLSPRNNLSRNPDRPKKRFQTNSCDCTNK